MEEKTPNDCLSRVAGRRPLVDVLAAAGAGPANRCAGMIRGGRVAVGGQTVRDLQVRADPYRDAITLDGRPLSLARTCRYLIFFKPHGVLCAFTDREGEREAAAGERGETEPEDGDGAAAAARQTLAAYIPVPGVYPAGRLDLDSEGLVLLTGDGWLIHRLSHPQYNHPKTYLVQVEGEPPAEALEALRQGVVVKGQRTAPAQVERLPGEPGPADFGSSGAGLPPRAVPIRYRETVPTAWLRVVLTEGRKRQVRHMTAAVGHPTLRLVRVGLGPLVVGDLRPGEWRDLEGEELEVLREMLHRPGPAGERRAPGREISERPKGRPDPSGQSREGGKRGPAGDARRGSRPRKSGR